MDVGRYEVLRQLSGGRFGAVWQGRDRESGGEVALKQLALAPPERWPAIRHEAEAAAALQDPRLARTYPAVDDGSSLWLVEEWVPGASLAALVPPVAQLSLRQSLGVLHEALAGLAHAHNHGVVHGGLSPRTVVVAVDGTPKVVEFAARLGHPDAAGIGAYASPEAFDGAPLTAAADVYSAAAMVAAALDGDTGAEAAEAHRLSEELGPVLRRAMDADPARRQPHAQALLDELDAGARRVLGAAWWTTEGLAAAAASVLGATAASAGSVAGAGVVAGGSAAQGGGAGTVSGSLNLGAGGLVPGAGGRGAGAVAGSVRQGGRLGRRGLIAAAAGGVVLIVVAVGAVAASRPGRAPVPAAAGGAAAPAGVTAAPVSSPSPTPSASPSPTPKAEDFTGTYRYQAVVIRSTASDVRVGKKESLTWKVSTTCTGKKCTTKVTGSDKRKTEMAGGVGGFSQHSTGKAQCVNLDTGKPTGQLVPFDYRRTLKPVARTDGQVTKLTGTSRYRQMKKCSNQVVKNYDVTWKLTLTYVKG